MRFKAPITGKGEAQMKKTEKNPGRRSLGQDLQMIRRGYGLLGKSLGHRMIVSSVLTAVFQNLIPFADLFFSARLLNELLGEMRTGRLLLLAGLTVLVNLLLMLAQRLAGYFYSVTSGEWYEQLEMLYAEKKLRLDYADVEDDRVRSLYNQIDQLRNYMNGGPSMLFCNLQKLVAGITQTLGGIGLSVSLFLLPVRREELIFRIAGSPFAILLLAGAIACTLWASAFAARKEMQFAMESSENVTLANRLAMFWEYTLAFNIRMGKDIRINNIAPVIKKCLDSFLVLTKQVMGAGNARVAKCQAVPTAALGCFTLLTYLVVALKSLGGAFGAGSIVQYVGAVTQLGMGLAAVNACLAELRGNNDVLQLTFDFLDIPNKKYEGTLPVEKRDDNEYEFEFRHVSFCYPGCAEYALRDVSFRFRVGERLAIVGKNGGGKTTFIKLLCRLYDPDEGEILLNGIDIRKYDYREYLSLFSVVFQDFTLFSFPLGQNVAAGMRWDEAKAESVLRKAGFGERLDALPGGLETCIHKDFDEQGVDFSGGENQKIALARALYKDAPFVVLDEPTAALDPIAEHDVYAHFNEIVGGKTAVYISHRLSSCRFCDRIAVFDGGRLAEAGSHEGLLRQGGLYARLWEAQAQYYTEEERRALIS